MKRDLDKIDDAVLALLHFTSFTKERGELAFTRAWRGHGWGGIYRNANSLRRLQ